MSTRLACLAQCYFGLRAIFRSIHPPSYWNYHFNNPMTDEELLRFRIQLHHLDIETGALSPPAISCFLPRSNFPWMPEDPNDALIQNAVEEASLPWIHRDTNYDGTLAVFGYLPSTLIKYSFEGNKDLESEFRYDLPQVNKYGWANDE